MVVTSTHKTPRSVVIRELSVGAPSNSRSGLTIPWSRRKTHPVRTKAFLVSYECKNHLSFGRATPLCDFFRQPQLNSAASFAIGGTQSKYMATLYGCFQWRTGPKREISSIDRIDMNVQNQRRRSRSHPCNNIFHAGYRVVRLSRILHCRKGFTEILRHL